MNVKLSDSKNDFLIRDRVNRIFNQAISHRLVYVIAGSGYGKTQAVRHYVERQEGAVIRWMQLTENDNNPFCLWETVTHTTGIDNSELANRLREIRFPETQAQFELFVEITKQMEPEGRIFLVLDEFHLINSKETMLFIERCIHIDNPNLCVIIISRVEPHLNAVSLFSRNEGVIVTEKDLCFNEQEVKLFLDYHGVSIPTKFLLQLIEITKGWPLAINLFALILKRTSTDRVQNALEAMRDNILKLFEFEAWNTLSPSVQKKLVSVSLLSRLPIVPVEEIFKDIQELDGFPELNAFIWFHGFTKDFKIHPLYLEFLQSKEQVLSEEEKQETYRLAAQWCSENDFKMEAVGYYEKTAQYDQMVRIFFSYQFKYSSHVSRYFLEVLNKIELASVTEAEPIVLFLKHYFTPLFLAGTGEYEQAEAYALSVVEAFQSIDTPFSVSLLQATYSNLVFIDMHLCVATHVYKGAEYLQKSILYFKKSSLEALKMGDAFINGSPQMFACLVGEGASLLHFDYFLASVRLVSGLIEQTEYKIYAGYDELVECEYAFFKNELSDARNHAYSAILKARLHKQYSIAAFAESYLLQIALQEGEIEMAEKALDQLQAYLEYPHFYHFQLDYDLYTTFFYTKIGILEKIPAWIATEEKRVGSDQKVPTRELIVLATYYIACKNYRQALIILRNSYPRSVYERYLFGEIRIALLTAVAWLQTGYPVEAVREFEKAYQLSLNGKFEMFFIEVGKEEFHPLATAALNLESSVIPKDWLKRIKRQVSVHAKKSLVIASAFKQPFDEESAMVPLSKREEEVLRDLYHGLSRDEIALNRHVSVNTVKKSLQSIYSKLNAQSGIDAVRIAIEKNLIK
ncbi:MAG: LuxR C-terminal-related transcriptional regulator [Turicibacter sp.]|nr:LuxR C-terminal-related transcriptional regulator [Turicibacter sp.]